MDGDKEFVEEALLKCPYCKSRNVGSKMILGTLMGGHACSDVECSDCGRKWVSDDRIRIKWQVPPEAVA